MNIFTVNTALYAIATAVAAILLVSTVVIFLGRRRTRDASARLALLLAVIAIYAASPWGFDILVRAWFSRRASITSVWVDPAWWFNLFPGGLAAIFSWLLLRHCRPIRSLYQRDPSVASRDGSARR